MAEANEIFAILIPFLFILLMFYIRFGKKISGDILRRVKEAIGSKILGVGVIKRPKLSRGVLLVIAVIVIVVVIFGWNYIHTTTYTFESSEDLKYWDITSGRENVKVENGCLVISGPMSMTLKNSSDMDWTKIEVTAVQSLGKTRTTISAGNYNFLYFSGAHPLKDNYNWVKSSTHFVGGFSVKGLGKMSYSEPRAETRDDGQAYNVFTVERGKGFYIFPNYKTAIGGVGGYFDSVDLIAEHGVTSAGKGQITLTFSGPQRIKSFTVVEGLLKF